MQRNALMFALAMPAILIRPMAPGSKCPLDRRRWSLSRGYAVLWQNTTLALGIKAVFLILAVLGNATMWMAVFADMGASLIVVANGMRLLRTQSTRRTS